MASGKPSRTRSSSERGCYYCSKEGHIARECPQKERDRLKKLECYACGGSGHMKRNCPFLTDNLKAASTNASAYSRSFSSPPRTSMASPPGDSRYRGWSESKGYRLGSASDSVVRSSSGEKSYSSVANTGVNMQKVNENFPKLEVK